MWCVAVKKKSFVIQHSLLSFAYISWVNVTMWQCQVKLSPQAEDEVLAARQEGLSQQQLNQIPTFTALGFFSKRCHEPQNVYKHDFGPLFSSYCMQTAKRHLSSYKVLLERLKLGLFFVSICLWPALGNKATKETEEQIFSISQEIWDGSSCNKVTAFDLKSRKASHTLQWPHLKAIAFNA